VDPATPLSQNTSHYCTYVYLNQSTNLVIFEEAAPV
jgi:hypothetical protein